MRGPMMLFAAWALHDVEEALTFPATTRQLAKMTGIEALRMSTGQSAAAIGMVGAVVGCAGVRGRKTRGRSRLYRYAVAGLEAHVFTHLLSSLALRRYTAGVVTAAPIMWPGAAFARRELADLGRPLKIDEWWKGGLVMGATALVAHLIVRATSEIEGRIRGRGLRATEPLQMEMPEEANDRSDEHFDAADDEEAGTGERQCR